MTKEFEWKSGYPLARIGRKESERFVSIYTGVVVRRSGVWGMVACDDLSTYSTDAYDPTCSLVPLLTPNSISFPFHCTTG